MPALFTHFEFGRDLLEKLDSNISNSIKSNIMYYDMFNQGWDNLFYYLPKWNYYRSLAGIAHKKGIKEYFNNSIQYIKDNNLQNNSELTNFVYGFINHYVVDTIIHPFVNYQVKNLNIPHSKIEFMIDTKLKKNSNNSYFKKAIPRVKFSKELNNLIDYVYLETHNYDKVSKIMNKSHNTSYYLYRYFINDNYGVKSSIYKIIDFITPFKDIKLNELTYYYKKFDNRILNNEKLTWNHPNNKEEKYNYSFYELYDFAQTICSNLVTLAYNIINNNEDINLLLDKIEKINIKNIQELLG